MNATPHPVLAGAPMRLLFHLSQLDVPVLTADRSQNGSEFRRPDSWQQSTPDGNLTRITSFTPGQALMAVMGGKVAVVDIDVKNGADIERTRQSLDAVGVVIYAEIATPSGGRHFYVAGHPDVPTIHATAGRDGFTGHPGVEIISYGANVYLPGTQRPRYGGGGYEVVSDNLDVLLDGGHPGAAEALAGWVTDHRVRAAAVDVEPAPPWDGTPPDTRQQRYLDATVKGECEALAAMQPNSGRNAALNAAAYSLGRYVAGAGLDEAVVVQELAAAADRCGLTAEDGPRQVAATIRSGLTAGRKVPRAVPAGKNPLAGLIVPPRQAGEVIDRGSLVTLEQQYVQQQPVVQQPAVPTGATTEPPSVPDIPRLTLPGGATVPVFEWDRMIGEQVARQLATQRARDLVKAAEVPPTPRPKAVGLRDFLAVADEPVQYRVDKLMTLGARNILTAPAKGSKTTLRDNLIRSLADGLPFLDAFPVRPVKRLILLDNELDERMLRRWLRDQSIRNLDAVTVYSLKGKLSSFNILDPKVRAEWAAELGPADLLIFDCLRPALDALGLSEDKEAGRFTGALAELLCQAGIAELLLVHHMGHMGERSRGDSSLIGWPDATWKLVRQDPEDGGPRQVYFSADGRDVDHPESLLTFDPQTHHLSLVGGSRRDTVVEALIPDVVQYVIEHSGASKNEIERNVEGGRDQVRKALARAIEDNLITPHKTPRGHFMYPNSAAPEPTSRTSRYLAAAGPRDTVHDLAGSPIRRAARRTSNGDIQDELGEPASREVNQGADRMAGRQTSLAGGEYVYDHDSGQVINPMTGEVAEPTPGPTNPTDEPRGGGQR